jgi:hypothetical protein
MTTLSSIAEEKPVSFKSFKDWLTEGEQLYAQAMSEYRSLEGQLEQLEQSLAVKKDEVNQIARVIGQPPIDNNRRLSAELVDPQQGSSVMGTVTRALTGRGLGRG